MKFDCEGDTSLAPTWICQWWLVGGTARFKPVCEIGMPNGIIAKNWKFKKIMFGKFCMNS